MRKVIAKILAPLNIHVTKAATKESVLSVIRKIHPYKTDKELIRIGPDEDGGYLVPDDLEGINTCFSPGVGPQSKFELACANKGMDIFMADKSVDGPAETHERFHFLPKFIGPYKSEDYITMDQWVGEKLPDTNSEILLQMDIEGHEYFTILNMSDELLQRCRVILVELHDLNKIWDRDFLHLIDTVFDKLSLTHTCVHNHPNNCSRTHKSRGLEIPEVIELSFLRNDRITHKTAQKSFPHPLDVDNCNSPSIILPKGWYAK